VAGIVLAGSSAVQGAGGDNPRTAREVPRLRTVRPASATVGPWCRFHLRAEPV